MMGGMWRVETDEKSLKVEEEREWNKTRDGEAKVSATGKESRGKWRSGLFIWAACGLSFVPLVSVRKDTRNG